MATDTTTVTFVGAKGGVGTTTIAAIHAIHLARQGRTVRLTTTVAAGVEDLAAVLGVPAPDPGEPIVVLPGLTLADHPARDVDNVVDGGTDCSSDRQGPVYVVVRNEYLSLRRALTVPRTTVGIVLVTEPNRALARRDVAEILDHPIVAELALEPTLARAVDAGVLATARRLPHPLLLPPSNRHPTPPTAHDAIGMKGRSPLLASWRVVARPGHGGGRRRPPGG